jgi:hypothetical protein
MAWLIVQPAMKADVITTECAADSGPDGAGWEIKESGVDDAEEGHPRYEWTIWQRVRKPASPAMGRCGVVSGAPAQENRDE